MAAAATLTSVIVPPVKHSATVIFMHGLGDSGAGWAPVAKMWSRAMPHVRFCLPNAPKQPVTINYGAVMPSWFDRRGPVPFADLDLRHDIAQLGDLVPTEFEGIDKSRRMIEALIDEERDLLAKTLGVSEEEAAKRMVIAGFSQGWCFVGFLLTDSFDRWRSHMVCWSSTQVYSCWLDAVQWLSPIRCC